MLEILNTLENTHIETKYHFQCGLEEYNNLEIISKLMEESLGSKIMDTYLVNRDLHVFKELSYLNHFLNTDLRSVIDTNNYTLVLSPSQSLIENDLRGHELDSTLTNTILELLNIYNIINIEDQNNLNDVSDFHYKFFNNMISLENIQTDLGKIINSKNNGENFSLGTLKLSFINKELLPLFQDLGYFTNTLWIVCRYI